MSAMKITLRPATDEDIPFAREAHHKGYYDTVIRQFGPWDEAAQDEFFEQAWSGVEHSILLCDGERCGYVSIDERDEYTHIREFVVHADYRDRGIGSAFLKDVITAAHARGVPVRLGVLLQNTALQFYKKFGFVEFHRDGTHIFMKVTP
jgi:ribosomal protein S18 acetylase RimI-like enzyme